MVHYMHIRHKQYKRTKIPVARLVYCIALTGLLVASCSATTTPVPVKPTETPLAEIIVISTFTPAPSALLEPTNTEHESIAIPESTPVLVQSVPEDITQKPPEIVSQVKVEVGDSLINIALQHEVPMAAIQLVNNMGDTTIVRVGQVLDIPRAEGWEDVSPYWVVYIVQAGESISKIASKYGLSVQEVVQANGFAEADLITIGQPIILPLDGPAKVAAVAQATFPTPAVPTTTPTPPTSEPPVVLADTPTPIPSSPTATPVPQPPRDFSGDTAAMRMEIYRLLNEQRAMYGLTALVWNDILANAAQKHADDCYQRGWCGHSGSDGSLMKTRIIREGYDPVRWSECWAWYGTPALAVEMWMDEAPPDDAHRRTILSTYLTEVGVGVVPGNGHGYYFIADFGTPR